LVHNSRYPIEAHTYGGEEGGLLGALALSESYKQAGREVRGMLNVEMVGWQPESGNNSTSTITVLSDPNAAMSAYMTEVVETYIPTADVRGAFCGVSDEHWA
jgi:bacterial leucyl aminopeptidase